ncbi:hypothetical protein D3C78_1294590 [compost metagenome]
MTLLNRSCRNVSNNRNTGILKSQFRQLVTQAISCRFHQRRVKRPADFERYRTFGSDFLHTLHDLSYALLTAGNDDLPWTIHISKLYEMSTLRNICAKSSQRFTFSAKHCRHRSLAVWHSLLHKFPTSSYSSYSIFKCQYTSSSQSAVFTKAMTSYIIGRDAFCSKSLIQCNTCSKQCRLCIGCLLQFCIRTFKHKP